MESKDKVLLIASNAIFKENRDYLNRVLAFLIGFKTDNPRVTVDYIIQTLIAIEESTRPEVIPEELMKNKVLPAEDKDGRALKAILKRYIALAPEITAKEIVGLINEVNIALEETI